MWKILALIEGKVHAWAETNPCMRCRRLEKKTNAAAGQSIQPAGRNVIR
jgi:hypothetical protein